MMKQIKLFHQGYLYPVFITSDKSQYIMKKIPWLGTLYPHAMWFMSTTTKYAIGKILEQNLKQKTVK